MPLGTRNWGGTDYHDSIFDPESQPQEYEQPYVNKWGTREERTLTRLGHIELLMSNFTG